ncbi:rCG46917, isoform CRA_g [Rattus norvegicus]|uniref:RCG46917, isoform CRA_g n=1 Tax=Rattus norvegicus TaxID=10116 RepID=A6IXL8_RAT|nr:rCG46917, isoform CRA_g [Rattus norvegicus]
MFHLARSPKPRKSSVTGPVPVLWEGSCRLASSAGCAWLGGCHHTIPVQMAGPIQRHIQVYAFP